MNCCALSRALLPGALCLSLLTGCGATGPVRHEVTGEVVFRNQPLDEGLIEFHPLDGQGSKSGASILNGEYHIPRDKGLFPGRYRVVIIGGDGTSGGGQAEPSAPRPGATPGKERIPPAYNQKSNLIREVKQGERNQFDFTIP
jgi:hypothetical protein